jgi:hypothetical protein
MVTSSSRLAKETAVSNAAGRREEKENRKTSHSTKEKSKRIPVLEGHCAVSSHTFSSSLLHMHCIYLFYDIDARSASLRSMRMKNHLPMMSVSGIIT